MTHSDAQREMLVEKYLLDELQGSARDEFEDHLFDCELCAADVQAGVDLIDGIRTKGPKLVTKPAAKTAGWQQTLPAATPWGSRVAAWAASALSPWVAAPALAACLAVIAVQSFVVQPRLHRELAQAQAPTLVGSDLLIKAGATRGPGDNQVLARAGGGFLLSVDIPADSRFREYRCTLLSPTGRAVWHTYLSPAQVNDTVTIHVPVGATAAGVNVVRVEGIPMASGAQAVQLFESRFVLKIGE